VAGLLTGGPGAKVGFSGIGFKEAAELGGR
jgi:hypothetical protein